MTYTATETAVWPCRACGDPVEVEANFCPTCGTRQIDGIPRPDPPEVEPVVPPMPPPRGERETMAWLVLAAGIIVLMLVAGVVVVTDLVVSGRGGDEATAGAAAGDGSAAEAMDTYAPLDEAWRDKHESVAEEGDNPDSAGLATAARDASAWIEVNSDALSALSAGATGASAAPIQELVGIYSRRYELLAQIEAEATAGGTGVGSASDELAELSTLDTQADAALCTLAGVMRAEGDDPADHLPSSAPTAC